MTRKMEGCYLGSDMVERNRELSLGKRLNLERLSFFVSTKIALILLTLNSFQEK